MSTPPMGISIQTYRNAHQWIKYYYGKADSCEECSGGQFFEWSNISRTYLKVRDDWQMLCNSCHQKYDKRKDECARGHKFTEDNTRYRKNGQRRCLFCDRENLRKFREKL